MNPGRLIRLAAEGARSLWDIRLYSILMMAGLIIGIAAVTVIYEMGEGVRAQVQGLMENMGFGADAFYIRAGGGRLGFRRGGSRKLSLTMDDVADLRRLDGVNLVVPHQVIRRKDVTVGSRHASTRMFGTTPGYVLARRWPVQSGRFFDDKDLKLRARVAVLGASLAKELFPGESPLGQSIRVGKVPFKVIGVLSAKGASPRGGDRDDRLMIPITTSQRRITGEDKPSGLRVGVAPWANKTEVVAAASDLLRDRHRLAPEAPDDFMIITPEALLEWITRQSRSMVFMLTIISGVSLLVAGIVIMNIMLVTVSERAREIGVRRALGARTRDIMTQFLLEAVAVSLAGGVCGLALGLFLARTVTWGLDLPTAFSMQGFAVSFAFSACVGLIFGLWPARRAASLPPLETLR
jgi:putative ABC transport system permease protein